MHFTDMCKNVFLSVSLLHALTHTDTHTITHTPPCFVSSTDSSNEFLLCVSQLAPTQGDFQAELQPLITFLGNTVPSSVWQTEMRGGGQWDKNIGKEELAV